MRSDKSYNKVFSENTPITVYPVIAAVLKKTDQILEDFRPKKGVGGEKFLKRWRQITSFITVSRLHGKYDFSAFELSQMDVAKYTHEEVKNTWDFIRKNRPDDLKAKTLKSKGYFVELCKEAAAEFAISNVDRVEKLTDFNTSGPFNKEKFDKEKLVVDLEFAMKVNELLPSQPWKPGMHKHITAKLKCSNKEYFQSVQLLIDEGIKSKQIDGVVYDSDGNVIAFDPERVNAQTLELLE